MTDKTKKYLRNSLIGVGAAGLTYAAMRKPSFSKIPEIAKAQEASHGKVTAIVSDTPYMRDFEVDKWVSQKPLSRIRNWFQQAGIQHVRAEDIKTPTKFEGAVYDDVNMTNRKWNSEKVTGDIVYNRDKQEFVKKLQEKYNFSQMPEFKKFTLSADKLETILKGRTHRTPESLYAALKDKNVYIKVRTGEGSGFGFQGTPSQILENKDTKEVQHLLQNTKKYIAQPNFKNDKEYRVHAFIQNGKVNLGEFHIKSVQGQKVYGVSHHVNKHPELKKFTEDALAEYATKNPDKHMILGVDVMHNTSANKFTIGEINDNSGSFRTISGNYLRSPHINYRALTGRHSKPVSLLTATGAGAAALGGTAIYDSLKKQSADKSTQPEQKLSPTLLGAAIGLPVAAYTFYKKRKPVFSADPYLRSIQEASKGKLTISHSGSSHPVTKFLRQLRHPFVKEVVPSSTKHYEGAVLNLGYTPKATGDVTINPSSVRDKYFSFTNNDIKSNVNLPHLKPWLIQTHSFEEALKLHGQTAAKDFSKMTKDQARKVIDQMNSRGNWFVKPREGQASRGLYSDLSDMENFSHPTNADRVLPRSMDSGYPKDPIGELQKNYKDYILQPNIKPDYELRFHTLGHKIVGAPVHRFPNWKSVSHGRILGVPTKFPAGFDKAQFEAALQRTLKSRKLDKDPAFMGWDAAVLPDKTVKMIEANSNSGFAFDFDPVSQTNMFYKDITGRHTIGGSVARGALAGAAIGVPTALTAKYYNKRKKEASDKSDKPINWKKIGIISGIGTGAAAATYLASEKLLAPQLYKVYRKIADRWALRYPRQTVSENLARKAENLNKIARSEKDTIKNTALVGAGAGLTAAVLYPKAKTHRHIINTVQSVNMYTGRIPINTETAKNILSRTGEVNIPKSGKGSLGAWLRSQKTRPFFGDDSELMIFGVNKDREPFVQNIPGFNKYTRTIKGHNYSIINDPTVGGLEFNVAPGNADDLFRRTHRAINEGAVQLVDPAQHALINYAHVNSTKKEGVGSSSHIHFQTSPDLVKSKVHRVSGATAMLNYLVPGAKQRAQGYIGLGGGGGGFGWEFPGTHHWTRPNEQHLLSKHNLPPDIGKKRNWMPEAGNIATEVRFNAPMHGNPHLSKKYYQLVELALSEHPAAARFEQLGAHLEQVTGGDAEKLYSPVTKKKVVNEFSKILQSTEFKNDQTLRDFIRQAKTGKTYPVHNVIKTWKKFKI